MGAQVMGRALDALARANVEVLQLSSSSFRQSFCFLVRSEELQAALQGLEAALALELAHGYLSPIDVDDDVGLLAIVGEGMRGTPGLAGHIFTAISRESGEYHRHRQGSSELTISIVVRRDGLEKAVRASIRNAGWGNGASQPLLHGLQARRVHPLHPGELFHLPACLRYRATVVRRADKIAHLVRIVFQLKSASSASPPRDWRS